MSENYEEVENENWHSDFFYNLNACLIFVLFELQYDLNCLQHNKGIQTKFEFLKILFIRIQQLQNSFVIFIFAIPL